MTTETEERLIKDLQRMPEFEIREFDVFSTKEIAGACIEGVLFGEAFAVEGSAKRGPGDKANRVIGERLAVARALQSLTNRALRQANGLVVHADNVAAANTPEKVAQRKKEFQEWRQYRG